MTKRRRVLESFLLGLAVTATTTYTTTQVRASTFTTSASTTTSSGSPYSSKTCRYMESLPSIFTSSSGSSSRKTEEDEEAPSYYPLSPMAPARKHSQAKEEENYEDTLSDSSADHSEKSAVEAVRILTKQERLMQLPFLNQKHKRQPIMAGNWKMNPSTEQEALELARKLEQFLMDNDSGAEIVLFPPHPFVSKVRDEIKAVGIKVGGQSIFFEDKGAYTGSVAVSMVKSIGCEYIICGHSERRKMFGDSDDAINRKVKKVLEAGLKPVLCIGETKEEYDLNLRKNVVAMQLIKNLAGVTKEQMKHVIIAYEPVWAIGTGLACGAEETSK